MMKLADAFGTVIEFLEKNNADKGTMDAFNYIRNGMTKMIYDVHMLNKQLDEALEEKEDKRHA